MGAQNYDPPVPDKVEPENTEAAPAQAKAETPAKDDAGADQPENAE